MQPNLKRKSQQLWSYLPHVPNTTKKPSQILKRKSQVTDKQVLNLTGGLFPLKLVDPAKDFHHASHQKVDHWIYTPIKQRNNKIGTIYHWVKEGEEQKIYHGDKFNIQPKVIGFSQQQYAALPINHTQWPYQQALQIFNLIQTYNYNFIVVQDRLETDQQKWQNSLEPSYQQMQNQNANKGISIDEDKYSKQPSKRKIWTVEDIKDIYFTVTRLIAERRGQRDTIRSQYIFDRKYEVNRKFELEKYMMRSKVDTDREKNLINQIRRLQIQIKKEERDQINLKKVLRLEQIPQQVFKLKQSTNIEQLLKNQKVFTRQQLLSKPIGLPGKIEQKMREVLDGLSIPDKIIANQQNSQLYDTLRKKILIMFSLTRYIRKRDSEKRTLEERKKKVFQQEEEDRNNKAVNPLGMQPKKKHKA